ncbi:MAG TPA: phospholipase D-like domain-containing protein [Burkholderiaceae bacterium]|nr:phospholipase D-like domain-containing protein [Burkholderiaceae bacterium]
MRIKRILAIALATAIATVLAILLVINFSLGDKQIDRRIPHAYAVADVQFLRTMGVLLGPPLMNGNRVEALLNGDQIFPAMLDAIRGAKQTITFETYIYWSGSIGREFASALAERAQSGVKVHLLLDWIGSNRLNEADLQRMAQAGVEIRRYNKPHWYTFGRLNNRTHRKLLVVDGRQGFTGGVGIADNWLGNAQSPDHWRDTHFKIEGPAVAQLQAAFLDNWMQVTGAVLHGKEYFPDLAEVGPHHAQMFMSSPGGGAESMQLMYLLSIGAATKSIRLSMSYFVPDDVAVRMLVEAVQRGVKVQFILPGEHTDTHLVRRASRAEWGRLLEAGAEIHEYQPTMFHCKVMIVDDLWVSVGSTNFDNRSFSVNDEANLNVYDERFARRQAEIFEDDLKRSRRVTLEAWQGRPWHDKVLDEAAGWLSSQL